jgi:hypothetical protein
MGGRCTAACLDALEVVALPSQLIVVREAQHVLLLTHLHELRLRRDVSARSRRAEHWLAQAYGEVGLLLAVAVL